MVKDYNYWKKHHDSNELKEFNLDDLGTLWLKVKSKTGKILKMTQHYSIFGLLQVRKIHFIEMSKTKMYLVFELVLLY